MQLQIKWKVTGLVFFLVIALLGAVVWKTQKLLIDDKATFIVDSSTRQLGPLRRLINSKLDEVRGQLAQVATRKESNPRAPLREAGAFDVVSLLQRPDGGAWTVKWSEVLASGAAAKWPAGYDRTLLNSLEPAFAKVDSGETVWVRLSDPEGKAVFAVMLSVEIQTPVREAPSAAVANESDELPETTSYQNTDLVTTGLVVGFTTANPLQAVVEDYIGSLTTVYVVDDRGYVASHTSKAYNGALFTEDPIVQDVVKSGKASASGRYENLESQTVYGVFERVENSNLYAVITTPVSAAMEVVDRSLRTALITGGGIGLIALMLAFLLGSRWTTAIQQVNGILAALIEGSETIAFPPARRDELGATHTLLADLQARMKEAPIAPVTAAAPPEEKREKNENTYERFSSGISHSMKGPLSAILGHTQLARSKSDNDEVKQHYVVIEREARKAKEIVDKLARFSGLDNLELKPLSLQDVVLTALNSVEHQLSVAGVNLHKKLDVAPEILGHSGHLQSMIVNLCMNAMQSMKDRPQRDLHVSLERLEKLARLKITDTGIGMSHDIKGRMFDPFFSAFEGGENMGLGLALVMGIVREHHGEVHVQTSPGQGTVITVDFPLTSLGREKAKTAAETAPRTSMLDLPPVKSLGGRDPLAGSVAVEMPTPPAPDEITLLAELPPELAGDPPPAPKEEPEGGIAIPPSFLASLESEVPADAATPPPQASQQEPPQAPVPPANPPPAQSAKSLVIDVPTSFQLPDLGETEAAASFAEDEARTVGVEVAPAPPPTKAPPAKPADLQALNNFEIPSGFLDDSPMKPAAPPLSNTPPIQPPPIDEEDLTTVIEAKAGPIATGFPPPPPSDESPFFGGKTDTAGLAAFASKTAPVADDDEGDEPFASIKLGGAGPATPPPVESMTASAPQGDKDEFRVQIRRPKLKG